MLNVQWIYTHEASFLCLGCLAWFEWEGTDQSAVSSLCHATALPVQKESDKVSVSSAGCTAGAIVAYMIAQ